MRLSRSCIELCEKSIKHRTVTGKFFSKERPKLGGVWFVQDGFDTLSLIFCYTVGQREQHGNYMFALPRSIVWTRTGQFELGPGE